MNIVEEVVWIDAMLLHQPGERRPMRMEMALLHAPRLGGVAFQEPLDVSPHAFVDQREQARRCRIKAIVEIENPVADVGEARVHH